jgi:uncharacterized protein (TIGR02594 family)
MELIKAGMKYLGIAEIPGAKHNPIIIKMLKKVLPWADKDEIAWCAASINWIADEAGYVGSGKADARSFLKAGLEVTNPDFTKDPVVAVFWRGSKNSWTGHVGIPLKETATHIFLMSGNQGNEFNIQKYPKSQLLAYIQLIRK